MVGQARRGSVGSVRLGSAGVDRCLLGRCGPRVSHGNEGRDRKGGVGPVRHGWSGDIGVFWKGQAGFVRKRENDVY